MHLAGAGRLSRCLPAPEPAAGHLGGGTPTDRTAELCCLVPAEMSLKHAYVPRLGNAALVVSARLAAVMMMMMIWPSQI